MVTSSDWPLPVGADWLPGDGVHFRVWAPDARRVDVALYGSHGPTYHALDPEGDAVYAALVPAARPGSRYKFRLDGGDCFPDPYSRSQPEGVHGPSEVVDPRAFAWTDEGWRGIRAAELIIYECHVGTYTPAGTFGALIDQLGELERLGVTALELMPVAAFPGRRNWGYDGVDLYAPAASYGGPDGLKRLVDAAHRIGLAVLLDVVYNHLGPSGNYLRAYSPYYFTGRYSTPWGEALNYDGEQSKWVRHYVVENACYWLHEYHLDGLRLDATHAIFDRSEPHILREIGERARQVAGSERQVVIIAEDHNNDVAYVRPAAQGGLGLDGVWADDFHHAMRTFLTGERDGYFADYSGQLADVAKTIRDGFLYQGERSTYLDRPRGTRVTDEPASAFVFCLQNHDQVGNRAFGDRLSQVVDKARYLTASAVLLLAPETPLIFMGQEFAATAPFLYFTDHDPELGRLVTAGRREEFKRFAAFADPARRETIPDPQAESTFLASKLDLTERARHGGVYRCYQDLLRLRRSDPVLRLPDRHNLRAMAIAEQVLLMLRWQESEHRLLVANFGEEIDLGLDATNLWPGFPDLGWQIIWSSAAPAYWDAVGEQPKVAGDGRLYVPTRCAVLLVAGNGA